jgi:aldose 1-epimerase
MSLQTISLHDDQAGTSAKILVDYGFNCYSFQAAPAGTPIEVLWSAPDFESGQKGPSHSGIPLLFPFPGRVQGTGFTFEGRQYQLTGLPDDGRGNAIHGFVLNRPWRVTEQTKTRAVGEFQASVDDASLLKMWPADFRISCSYELAGNTLKSVITVTNPDKKPLPFGLGTHPYFRVPLGPGGVAADCKVTVLVTDYWPLENMLPGGQRQSAEGSRGLKAGLPFSETKLDDVFTGVQFNGGRALATIVDAKAGRKLTVSFDAGFPNCVVYNPPHREAICLEPYSCVPDPFSLEDRGISTGLRVLKPGESFAYHVDICLE